MSDEVKISEAGSTRSFWLVGGTYALLTLVMLSLPLVNSLHAESCAVLAATAFFLSGLDAIGRFRAEEGLLSVGRVEFGLLLIPLAIYQLARIVIPGCDQIAGFTYFALFPVVSMVLAVALAYLLTAGALDKASRRFVIVGVLVLILPVIWDLGFHPQFYVYNHVFGGVLGPIYDLDLAFRPGLLIFRLMTLIWAGVFMLIGFRLRTPDRRLLVDLSLPVLGALLVAAYVFGPELGINTTAKTIADGLGSSIRTEHFVINYDARVLPQPEADRIAADHEFRYEQLAKRLGISIDQPIMSYIYPTATIRARLTGAGYTNIAPVWLRRPQVHVLYESYDLSFTHELAHVFSRDMGIPIIHASFRVGLVEGFAVAMEPPIGLPDATDQIAAIRNNPAFDSLYGGQSLASRVVASLSPSGFWSGRGAVSYTTMGSFVRYLLDTYGPGPFRQVYGMTSFRKAYGVDLKDLAASWETSLLGRKLPPAVADLAAARFSVLSIFERRCPHDTPPAARRYWDALDNLQLRDTTAAEAAIDDVLKLYPDFAPALSIWAKLALQRGAADGVVHRLGPVLSADSAATQFLGLPMADALVMVGRPADAVVWYDSTLKWQSPFSRSTLAVLRLRLRLIDSPELIGAANGEGGWPAAIDTLRRADEPAARVLGALAAADGYDFSTAFSILVGTSGSDAVTTAGSRWSSWASLFALRSGNLQEAERFRKMAVQAARDEDDSYEVARLEDFGERIEWTRRSQRP